MHDASPSPARSSARRLRAWSVAAAAAAALGAGACGRPDELPITDIRTLPAARAAVPPDAPDWHRLRLQDPAGLGEGRDRAHLAFDLPEGWSHVPTPTRPFNFAIAGQPTVDVYLTALPRLAGTLADNVNRWRKQMGLERVEEGAVHALPRRGLLTGDATLVELEGAYTPMGASEAFPDTRLLGLVFEAPEELVFFKMVGPAAAVAAQREAFLAIAASFRPQLGPPPRAPDGTPAEATTPEASPPGEASKLAYDVPEGWTAQGRQGMREVTLGVEGTQASCWVMFLSGTAGGVVANVNRWRGEVGADALEEAGVAGLPRLDVLGTQAVLVEARGDYKGMSGAPLADALLWGLICPLAGRTLFVKMVGSAQEMEPQRQAFLAFCRSLRWES